MAGPKLPRLDLTGVAVGALGLAIQLAYLARTTDDPTFTLPVVDAATYHQQAVQFAQGGLLFKDAFWQPPLFPLVLGGLYRIAGANILVAKLALAGLAALSCVLIWWIGRRVFSRRVGVVAGVMAAAYGPFLFFSTQLLPTGMAVFLDLVALALWLLCIERPVWYLWLLFGLSVGAAAITIPNALVIFIIAMGGILLSYLCAPRSSAMRTIDAEDVAPVSRGLYWRAHARSPAQAEACGSFGQLAVRLRVAGLAAALLGTAIPIGSVAVRNYLVSGKIVPISTNGGINFFIGNNPRSDETVAIRPGEAWQRLARQSYLYGARTRADQDSYFFRQGLAYATEQPIEFLRGLGCKALQLINAREIPRNVDPYIYRDYSWLLAILLWHAGPFGFPFGLLAPLAAVGILISLSQQTKDPVQRAGRYALLAFIIAYGASVALFFVTARYRLPAVMVMTVFAAAGACAIWDWIRTHYNAARGRRMHYVATGAFTATAIVVNLPLSFATDGVNFRAELAMCVGHADATAGRLEQAEKHLREALRLDLHYADAAGKLASVLRTRGKSEEAEGLLREALTWDGQSMQTRQILAELLHEKGQTDDAVLLLEQGLSMDPTSPEGHTALAKVLADSGRMDEAIVHYRQAGDLTEESGPILIRLADLLVRTGAYKEAIERYRQGLWRIEPDPATLNRVAWLLATCPVVELRDCKRAIEIAEHVCRITEYANPVAMDTLAAAYAECRRFEDAVKWGQRAVDTAEANNDSQAVALFLARLHIYEARLSAGGS